MVYSIVESISSSLDAEFGEGYNSYTELEGQGFTGPCFFIQCVNCTSRVFPGRRCLRENSFCIQYFPAGREGAQRECYDIAERLFSCLEALTVAGDLMRGTKMSYEVVDGVLNFFVNYDFFFYKASDSNPMETLEESIRTKG